MIESDNTIWIILAIVVSIVVPISIFAGTQIVKTRRAKRAEVEDRLKIHFEDVKREAIAIMTPCNKLNEWYGAI